ncbi:MAG: OsmC family protein [Firmicutes bacterium]|nr:OsmC family protein [Bacillota bacterium]
MADLFRATGVWKEDGSYTFSSDGAQHTGEMNPPELLTAALVSCTGITMHMVMKRMKVAHEGFTITGVARKADDEPARFTPITVDASIHGVQLSDAQKKRLRDLTEKYCPVTQTLRGGAETGLSVDS